MEEIDTTYGWWYKACYDCKGGVKDYDGTFWCTQCGKNDQSPVPWYIYNPKYIYTHTYLLILFLAIMLFFQIFVIYYFAQSNIKFVVVAAYIGISSFVISPFAISILLLFLLICLNYRMMN